MRCGAELGLIGVCGAARVLGFWAKGLVAHAASGQLYLQEVFNLLF
jgi:hypothetical protein